MIKLNIDQNIDVTRNVDDNIIEFLYQLCKGLDDNVDQYLRGRLEIVHGYADAVDFLTSKFEDLYITSTGSPYIRFKDLTVQSKLATAYGDGIGLTTSQASSLVNSDTLKTLFRGDTNITSFDELSYFINIRYLTYDAFRGCTSLETIDLTNVNTVGNLCFSECYNLKYIKNYQNVTTFGSNVFQQCDLRGDLDFSYISNVNDSVSNRWLGFYRNRNLNSVIMPSSTKYLCSFQECENLTSVTGLENVINTSDGTFMNCYKLQNVNLPNVKTIAHRVFEHCDTMTSIDLPNLIECSYGAFNNNQNVTEINVPLLTNHAYSTFSSNPNLKTINCQSLSTIPRSTFQNNPKLTTINMNFESVTTIEQEAFRDCKSLTSLSFPNVISCGLRAFNTCNNLEILDIPKLKSVDEYCFDGCSKLQYANFPQLEISENKYNVFCNDSSLTSVTLGNVTYIPEKCFYNCTALSEINIDWSKVENIGQEAFYNCNCFTNNNEPIEFTNLQKLYKYSLRGFKVPYLKFPALQYIQDEPGLDNAITIELNSNITSLPINCFWGCSHLSTVSHLENVVSIGNKSFYNNNNSTTLTNLDFSSNLKQIGSSAFYKCSEIEYISTETIYPETIGSNAFENCSKLKGRIDLSQCTSIGEWTFTNCSSFGENKTLDLNLSNQTNYPSCALQGTKFKKLTLHMNLGYWHDIEGNFDGRYPIYTEMQELEYLDLSDTNFYNWTALYLSNNDGPMKTYILPSTIVEVDWRYEYYMPNLQHLILLVENPSQMNLTGSGENTFNGNVGIPLTCNIYVKDETVKAAYLAHEFWGTIPNASTRIKPLSELPTGIWTTGLYKQYEPYLSNN